jgi:hypothetical protein
MHQSHVCRRVLRSRGGLCNALRVVALLVLCQIKLICVIKSQIKSNQIVGSVVCEPENCVFTEGVGLVLISALTKRARASYMTRRP